MSYRLIDKKGKLLPANARIGAAAASKVVKGEPLYHYEIYVETKDAFGKKKLIRRRFWLPDHAAAIHKERDLREGPVRDRITWREAHRHWMEHNRDRFSPAHIANSAVTLDMWAKTFGEQSQIESTTLEQFSSYFREMAKRGTGRSSQTRRAHLLAIARWARANGLVTSIPFEHAPKPPARMAKRVPATVGQYKAIGAALPESMRPLWWLLGLTGMRVSAACGIREDDIGAETFAVTTKFSRRVDYPLTDPIRQIFHLARKFKAKGYLKGRGKNKVVIPIDTEYLFCNARGMPWTKDTFNHKLQAVQERALLKPVITPHQIRHMAGTLLAENNFSADMIQAGLAHESRESAEVYIDKTMAMKQTALSTLEESLGLSEILSVPTRQKADLGVGDHQQESASVVEKHFHICPDCGRKIICNKE